MCRLNPCKGFTLIELLVVIALISISLALSVPHFQKTIYRVRISQEAERLTTSFALMRAEAIKRNSGAAMCPSSDGVSCDASLIWSDGWIVFADQNENGAVDPGGDTILQIFGPASQGVVAFSTKHKHWFGYRSHGRSVGNSGSGNGTFIVCYPDSSEEYGYQVVISITGRARMVAGLEGKECKPA